MRGFVSRVRGEKHVVIGALGLGNAKARALAGFATSVFGGGSMAGGALTGEQDLVDHVDDAVICLNVGDDDVGLGSGSIRDRYALG